MIEKLLELGRITEEESIYFKANMFDAQTWKYITEKYETDIEMKVPRSNIIETVNVDYSKHDKDQNDLYIERTNVNPIKEKGVKRKYL